MSTDDQMRELTARVEALERENSQLRSQLEAGGPRNFGEAKGLAVEPELKARMDPNSVDALVGGIVRLVNGRLKKLMTYAEARQALQRVLRGLDDAERRTKPTS